MLIDPGSIDRGVSHFLGRSFAFWGVAASFLLDQFGLDISLHNFSASSPKTLERAHHVGPLLFSFFLAVG